MGRDLAIDLGTANTLVYRQGDGIVVREPTAWRSTRPRARSSRSARRRWRRIGADSGNVVGMRPLREGTITDFEVTQRFLEAVIRSAGGSRLQRPRVLIGIPSDSSEVEKRAMEEAVGFAGGKGVTLVEEPLAAAIGAGLPIHEPMGHLIADIGGARAEMAVVSMGGVIAGRTVRIGGFDLDAAIIDHIRDTYGVAIGENAAEEIEDRHRLGVPGAGRPRGPGHRPRPHEREHGRGARRGRRGPHRDRRRPCGGSSTPRSGRSATPRRS